MLLLPFCHRHPTTPKLNCLKRAVALCCQTRIALITLHPGLLFIPSTPHGYPLLFNLPSATPERSAVLRGNTRLIISPPQETLHVLVRNTIILRCHAPRLPHNPTPSPPITRTIESILSICPTSSFTVSMLKSWQRQRSVARSARRTNSTLASSKGRWAILEKSRP